MLNPKYEVPLELFSWQHLLAVGVVLSIILILFFTRNFFIKHKIADKIVRYTLAFLITFFAIFVHFMKGFNPIISSFILPYPLCGFLDWFTVVALLSNSQKLEKLIYPLAITGASLSLIVAGVECSFPHVRAFQYFITHGSFLIAALYFVFTRKINKYTLKDLGNSCLFLFGASVVNLISTFVFNGTTNGPITTDEFFVIAPPKELAVTKEALGQIPYTILYVLLIVTVQFTIYGLTKLLTRKREDVGDIEPTFKNNKVLNYLSGLSTKTRKMILGITIGLSVYNTVLIKQLNSAPFLIVLDIIFFALIIGMFVVNEVVKNYELYKLKTTEKESELQKEISA